MNRYIGALIAITIIPYGAGFGLGIAQDSRVILTQDTRVAAVSAQNVKLILTKDYWWPLAADRLYRPITTASFMLLGVQPGLQHAANILLHAANVLLIFRLAITLLGGELPALFAAALWAVHPIGTEAVANIAGRADLLAASAVLGGLVLYIRGGSLALFGLASLGVFAKENAAILIGLMLLWDLAYRKPLRWPYYGIAAGALMTFLAARALVLANVPWPQQPYLDNLMRGADWMTARLTAIKVIGLDLLLLVFPVPLSSDRSFREIGLSTWSDPYFWAAAAAVCTILTFAFANYRRNPLIFWLAGFFGIALLPVSNLLFVIGAVMGERFLYLPAVAFAIALAAWAFRKMSRSAAAGVLAVVAVLYGIRTFARTLEWDNDLTLASADVQSAPESARLHDTLAKALYEQNDPRTLDRSIAEQEIAWSIVKALPAERSTELIPAHLGIYYFTKGDYQKALTALERAREISLAGERAFDRAQAEHGKPPAPRRSFQLLYAYLGYDLLKLGRIPEAIEAFRAGRDRNPRFVEMYNGMAEAGNPEVAAQAMIERGYVEGFSPEVLRGIADAYAKIPGGNCAVLQNRINVECPPVRAGLCQAGADLAASYREARMPADAAAVMDSAARNFGCR